jgi:5'-deoxynucleotidase YfbR-like HD superfamily hydrolase
MKDLEGKLRAHMPGREARLAAIPRFSLYAVMYYRSNLLSHSRHVAWLTRELAPLAREVYPSFDPIRAEVLALVHDDAEMITGDVQAGNKVKMSPAELRAIKEWETVAIDRLAESFPGRIADYSYRDLLLDSHTPATVEAWVVKYADKLDALGETLHEIFGGNRLFSTNVRNQYGFIPTPLEFYEVYFGSLEEETPELTPLLELDHPLLRPLPPLTQVPESTKWGTHIPETFRGDTGYEPYDAWKQAMLRHGDEQEIIWLTTQREFYRVEPTI